MSTLSIFKQYMKVKEADPDAHAKLSASGSKRWLGCPGSVRLSDGVPSVDTEDSKDGTNAHTLLQFILENYSSWQKWLDHPGAKAFKKFINFNDAQLDSVLQAAQYVWEEMDRMEKTSGVRPILYTEQRLELMGVGHGTSDIILYQPHVLLHVMDYKNGRWKVDPFQNTQGLYYACGAAEMLGWNFHDLWITIIQPNAKRLKRDEGRPPIDTWKTTYKEAEKAFNMFQAGAKATRKKNAPLVPNHDYCFFCLARPKCPAQMAMKHEKIMGRFKR